MHGQLVRQVEPGLRRLDRIDVADHVGDRHIGRGQLLDESAVARQPRNRHRVALPRDARAARRAQRGQRVVVDFAPGHDRNPVVEQVDERAENAALRLAAQPEQNEIVAREDGVDELRHDRLVVADDAGEQVLAVLQLAHKIVANFLLDRPRAVIRLSKFAQSGDARHGSILSESAPLVVMLRLARPSTSSGRARSTV